MAFEKYEHDNVEGQGLPTHNEYFNLYNKSVVVSHDHHLLEKFYSKLYS